MMSLFATATACACLFAAAWVTVEAVRKRRPGWVTIIGLGVSEVLALASAVFAVARWFGDTSAVSAGLLWGYVACLVGVLPLAFYWGVGEKSMWGNGVMAVGAVTVAVLSARVVALW